MAEIVAEPVRERAPRLGINDRLVLQALIALTSVAEGDKRFPVGQVTDQIWAELQSRDKNVNALTTEELQQLQRLKRIHGRVLAAKRRKRTALLSEKIWKLTIQAINPAKCFRKLAGLRLIERTERGIALTERGQSAANEINLPVMTPCVVCGQHFERKHGHARYCSATCKYGARRRRREARLAARPAP
jgi:hypothetical protein